MSYSLKINASGDLDMSTGLFQNVTGVEKLTQDLGLWLREPYGTDRFHPLYGSVLDQYIGSNINSLTEHEVKTEVIRVLNAFQQIQLVSMRKNPSKYDLDELLDSVEDVKIRLTYDTVFIDIKFRTALGSIGRVTGEVSV